MNKKIGFIGCGNMGKAILRGLIASQLVKPDNIWVYTPSSDNVAALSEQFAIQGGNSAQHVAETVDILFVAVKPGIILDTLASVASSLKTHSLVISIAAGISLDSLGSVSGNEQKIIRAMPNTPAVVNAAMTSLTPNARVTSADIDDALAIFRSFGKAEIVSESLIHSVIGVSGSSPAYVFMFIEAMADAAVLGGMPRQQAYRFAAQAVMGAAKMVLETGSHPGELKDKVCSPGGTTIEAVRALEAGGLRATVIEAVVACMDKSQQLGKI